MARVGDDQRHIARSVTPPCLDAPREIYLDQAGDPLTVEIQSEKQHRRRSIAAIRMIREFLGFHVEVWIGR